MSSTAETLTVAIIGAGIMGGGIAQVAARAGHPVLLYDNRDGAAAAALDQLAATFDKLVDRGKIGRDSADDTLARISPAPSLAALADAAIVIEAVVENLEIKRGLLRELESIVADDCILATNTSSLSISAIANGMRLPGRLVGMHFFNPVPLMKLVEVVSGLHSDAAVADRVFTLAESWGKVAVHAASTPGFIVNRIARPFYAEALALLQECAAAPAAIDACLRGAGFRMGPCELMDLIGHDTNFAVTRSVFEANFYDKRFQPSPVQQALVDGGLLGRKSGRGFYDYSAGGPPSSPEFAAPGSTPKADFVAVHGGCAVAGRLAGSLVDAGYRFERVGDSDWTGLQIDAAQLRLTDGRTAGELGREAAVFDLPLGAEPGAALAWAHSPGASPAWIASVPHWLALCGYTPMAVADAPGLVVARTIAMLINEAADAVLQGVCTADAADAAMKLGVNYPAGPFDWLDGWGVASVVALLDRLDAWYRGERYRTSPWLRRLECAGTVR